MGVHSKWTETTGVGNLPVPVTWNRPTWRATGARARLVYVVAGDFPDGRALRVDRHLKESPLAAALQARLVTRESNEAWVTKWFTGAFGALLTEQMGAEAAAVVAAAPAVLLLQADLPDPRELGYLRDAMQLVALATNEHTLAVFDMYAALWLKPDAVRHVASAPGFRIRDHLHTAASRDEAHGPGLWVYSRGAIKLGRPEVEIRHVRPDARALKAAAMVLEGAMRLMADGLEPLDGARYSLPGFTERFTVVTRPDDSETTRHYMNRSIELRDYNPRTGKPDTELRAILAEAEQKLTPGTA